MTKSAHDQGCASRPSEKCDCEQGRERRIKQKAQKTMKRRASQMKSNWWLERFFGGRSGDAVDN